LIVDVSSVLGLPTSSLQRSVFLNVVTASRRSVPCVVLRNRGAGGELEPAQLLLRQRRLLERVVLLAGEHAPEQEGELACRGDDRDLVAAAGTDA
jgi:hypothetical protein